jgi:hypothetical protein
MVVAMNGASNATSRIRTYSRSTQVRIDDDAVKDTRRTILQVDDVDRAQRPTLPAIETAVFTYTSRRFD